MLMLRSPHWTDGQPWWGLGVGVAGTLYVSLYSACSGLASTGAREPPVGSRSHCLAAAQASRSPNPLPAGGPGGDGGAWQLGIWTLGWGLPLPLHRQGFSGAGGLS